MTPTRSCTRSRCCAGTATRVGRDPAEIEVTALFRDLPAAPNADDVVHAAETLAKIGVSTLVAGAVGDDPGAWLESTFGPAMDRLAAIQPAR